MTFNKSRIEALHLSVSMASSSACSVIHHLLAVYSIELCGHMLLNTSKFGHDRENDYGIT